MKTAMKTQLGFLEGSDLFAIGLGPIKFVSSMTMALIISLLPIADAIAASNTAFGILSYTTESDATLNWTKERFSTKISGRNPGTMMSWNTYYDIYGPSSVTELLRMKEWAVANRVNSEEMLLHSRNDFTSALNPSWKLMDKFDNFEGANGVLQTADDANYTDLTSVAYSGRITWRNTVYIGYEEAFDQVNLVLATPGSAVTMSWEYWDGSNWVSLPLTDGSSAFTVSGQISFVPPANWSRKVINKSRNKFFVRCRIPNATTYPVTASIKGDNWLRGGGNLCRGWDPTSSSIVNSGELKYNATPPAGSSAKFPYQARISYWSSNHFIANPADFQTVGDKSTRTWAKYAAIRINEAVTTSGYSGVMCDDGERNTTSDGVASTSTDFVEKTANTWVVESTNKYADIVNYAHELNGTTKVGINAQTKKIVKLGDWNLAEYHTFNWKSTSPRAIAVADSTTVMTYDDYLSVNNPTHIVGILLYQDTQDIVPGKTATWDRGNRGPMVALSKHYVAANDNTIFSYYSQGGYTYSNTDEVYLKDGTIRHQSTDPIPAVDLVKRWGTYFPAMGVDLGVPGQRNLLWKSHTEIGGVQDVWRRDFSNAIVLHRPATYSTTDTEYDTYSSPMDLSGIYYPLLADGTTGDAVASIALRAGEGAILLKVPAQGIGPAPTFEAPKNLRRMP